jgi:hypothetical protein
VKQLRIAPEQWKEAEGLRDQSTPEGSYRSVSSVCREALEEGLAVLQRSVPVTVVIEAHTDSTLKQWTLLQGKAEAMELEHDVWKGQCVVRGPLEHVTELIDYARGLDIVARVWRQGEL